MTPLVGQHLLLDGTVTLMPRHCGDLHDIMLDLAQLLGVQVLGVTAERQKWGLSAMMVIAESHIAMHLHTAWRWGCIDVFSCKTFNTVLVVEWLAVQIGFQARRDWLLDRGVR